MIVVNFGWFGLWLALMAD